MNETLTGALAWIRSLPLPEKVKAVPLTTWACGVMGGVLAWGLLESLPQDPISRPVSAGFAMSAVIAAVLGVGWLHNTMVTDEHEERLKAIADLVIEMAEEIDDLRAQLGLSAELDKQDEQSPDAVNDGLTVEAPIDLDVDTDQDTAADDSLEPAATLPAADTARIERVEIAGGLRLPPEGQQPPPEPEPVDDVDLQLARFGLRTSEGRRPA